MNDEPQQTRRILDKLSQTQAADPKHEVYGAESHGYGLHAPASLQAVSDVEARLGIALPEAYRRFVLEVGSGGDGCYGSAAGPFYGIYGVDDRLERDWLPAVLAKPCILSPGMSQPDWAALVASLGLGGDLDDAAFDEAQDTLFGGLLPLGSQGCSIYHGLVVNGPFAGRVVNFDMDFGAPPVFAFETDFLDWFERWLDEVIAGDLPQKGSSWFGYTRGGPEDKLLAGWRGSDDAHTAQERLAGCRIAHVVEAGLAKRQTASTYLKELAAIGILREHKIGREKIFLNPGFIDLLKRD